MNIDHRIKNSIEEYNSLQDGEYHQICSQLCNLINVNLLNSTSKVWHGAPVWFLDGNPVVGYSKQKAGVRLMFWSGADFGEEKLRSGTGKFKDASIFYNSTSEVDSSDLKVWLKKAKEIQWDYKNIVKHKGQLFKIKV